MSNFLSRHPKPLLHVAFWLVYASFFFYQISYARSSDLNWQRIVPDFGFHFAGLLALSYLNYFYFLPQLLDSKRLGTYLLRFGPVFIVGVYLFLTGKRAILRATLPEADWLSSPRFTANVILSALMVVVFVGLLRFVEDYFAHEARRTELENAHLTSELRFLRAQVNPHFLFNTLNNLYYLAVNQSPQTPEVIEKLAGLMRYLLHDSNHASVPLEREVEYMRNYIALEQLRLDGEVAISFTVTGPTAGVRVVPLLLVTFLENAFKHGIGGSGGGSFIEVVLAVTPDALRFSVANSVVPEREKTTTEPSGIGLANAQRRLELGYPAKHALDVERDDERYTVTLDLQLA